jgi:hypothetical protein
MRFASSGADVRCAAAGFEHEACVRVEEQCAAHAAKDAARDDRVRIREHVVREHLALARALAPLAPKLAVERFERAALRIELVGEALDGAPRERRVEFHNAHAHTVRPPPRAAEAGACAQEELS